MSKERFEIIKHYGARVIATPGCESNVKEIYDKSKELYQKDPKRVRILNQFSEFGNYRFHYYVTGNTMIELVKEKDLGNGRIAAVVAGVGSAGTIACADRVKQIYPEAKKIFFSNIKIQNYHRAYNSIATGWMGSTLLDSTSLYLKNVEIINNIGAQAFGIGPIEDCIIENLLVKNNTPNYAAENEGGGGIGFSGHSHYTGGCN